MARYVDLTTKLATRIAEGDLAAGVTLPSVRELAAVEGTTPTTVGRAYHALADAGAIVVEARRAARVSSDGALAARALLRGRSPFRLAGSDDPALSMLVAEISEEIVAVGASGSYRGLSALWAGRADGACLHLRHRDGDYNAPFARAVLHDREPVLVHLWRREQGLIVPSGNPAGVERVADLEHLRIARRPTGTGTRTALHRLLLDAAIEPERVSGPTVELHLDVALAIATGEADAGLGLRSAATALELDYVPLGWEPFQVATTRSESAGLRPVVDALADPAVGRRVADLGGYDLAHAGEIVDLRAASR